MNAGSGIVIAAVYLPGLSLNIQLGTSSAGSGELLRPALRNIRVLPVYGRIF